MARPFLRHVLPEQRVRMVTTVSAVPTQQLYFRMFPPDKYEDWGLYDSQNRHEAMPVGMSLYGCFLSIWGNNGLFCITDSFVGDSCRQEWYLVNLAEYTMDIHHILYEMKIPWNSYPIPVTHEIFSAAQECIRCPFDFEGPIDAPRDFFYLCDEDLTSCGVYSHVNGQWVRSPPLGASLKHHMVRLKKPQGCNIWICLSDSRAGDEDVVWRLMDVDACTFQLLWFVYVKLNYWEQCLEEFLRNIMTDQLPVVIDAVDLPLGEEKINQCPFSSSCLAAALFWRAYCAPLLARVCSFVPEEATQESVENLGRFWWSICAPPPLTPHSSNHVKPEHSPLEPHDAGPLQPAL